MTAPVKLFSDEFASYFRDDQHRVLELRWSKATKSMSEEQFRNGLKRLAQFLERGRIPNALIDVTNFAHEPSDDFESWRERQIIPRYNSAGVKKFAFLLPPNASATVENGTQPTKEGVANFLTGYFNSRDRALQWFASP